MYKSTVDILHNSCIVCAPVVCVFYVNICERRFTKCIYIEIEILLRNVILIDIYSNSIFSELYVCKSIPVYRYFYICVYSKTIEIVFC